MWCRSRMLCAMCQPIGEQAKNGRKPNGGSVMLSKWCTQLFSFWWEFWQTQHDAELSSTTLLIVKWSVKEFLGFTEVAMGICRVFWGKVQPGWFGGRGGGIQRGGDG